MVYTPAFWAMAVANLCHTASFSTFFLLPLYLLAHNGDQSDVGVVMGVFALASALCRPWISEMIDRIGRKRSYTIGSAIMMLAPLLYLGLLDPLGSMFPLLLLLRAVHGVGLAIGFTAIFTFMADILPQERLNEGLGMFGISGLLGIAAGPMLAEPILKRFGFPGIFVVGALLSAIAFLVHQPLKESSLSRSSADTASFFSLLKRGKFVIVSLLSLLFGVSLAATGNFIASLAEERTLGYISLYYLCYSGGAVTVRFIGGRMADKYGENRVLPYSIILYTLGLLILPVTYSPEVLWLAGVCAGIGHGLLFPILNTMAVRNEITEVRGKATGIFTGAMDIGIFAGSFILGYIGNQFGLGALFTCAGLSMALTLGLFRFQHLRTD